MYSARTLQTDRTSQWPDTTCSRAAGMPHRSATKDSQWLSTQAKSGSGQLPNFHAEDVQQGLLILRYKAPCVMAGPTEALQNDHAEPRRAALPGSKSKHMAGEAGTCARDTRPTCG